MISVALVVLMAVAMAVSASAGYSESMDAPYIYIRKADEAPKIDGTISPDEWPEATYTFTGDAETFATAVSNTSGWYYHAGKAIDENYVGPETCYMNVYLSWDSDNLYVALDTNFAGFQQKKAADVMWQNYCVQLQLGDKDIETYDDWGMAINEDGAVMQYSFTNSKATEFDVKITRDGDHVVYECALPWSEFVFSGAMKTGSMIGFTCGVTLGQGNGDPFTTINFGESSTSSSYHTKTWQNLKDCYLVPANGEYVIPETEPETKPETKAETKAETKTETKAETKAPSTSSETKTQETKAPAAQQSGSNTGLIIGIIAAVVVVAAIVVFVVVKKKKAE